MKPPRLEDIKLAPPRLAPPASLPFCSTALYDRAAHTYGKSFPEYVRGLLGDYSVRRTSSPIRATKPSSPPCSIGPEASRRA